MSLPGKSEGYTDNEMGEMKRGGGCEDRIPDSWREGREVV